MTYGVLVTIKGQRYQWRGRNQKQEKAELTAQYTGYGERTLTVKVTKGGKTKTVTVRMSANKLNKWAECVRDLSKE